MPPDGDCKRRRVDEPVNLTALEDTENDHAECDDPANYNRDIQNDPSLFKFYRSFLLRLVYVMSKARRSLLRTVCRSVCAACCIREFFFGVPSCFHARCRYAVRHGYNRVRRFCDGLYKQLVEQLLLAVKFGKKNINYLRNRYSPAPPEAGELLSFQSLSLEGEKVLQALYRKL